MLLKRFLLHKVISTPLNSLPGISAGLCWAEQSKSCPRGAPVPAVDRIYVTHRSRTAMLVDVNAFQTLGCMQRCSGSIRNPSLMAGCGSVSFRILKPLRKGE